MQRPASGGARFPALDLPPARPGAGPVRETAREQTTEPGFRPIFIIGPHRAGTTILSRLLMESGCFNVVTAYHIAYREQLLQLHEEGQTAEAKSALDQAFARNQVRDRGYDAVAARADAPEEYCFALRYQGRRPLLSARNLPSFLAFCRTVQRVEDPTRPLLLKNPFDTDRFLAIRQMLPGAGFIFIHRNPVDVANSQIRAIRSVLAARNPYLALMDRRYRQVWERPWQLALARAIYGERSPLLCYQVCRNLAHNCDYMLHNFPRLDGAAIGLTYGELCGAPTRTVQRILDFFGLPARGEPDYARWIQPRAVELLPEVAARRPRIEARNAVYCRAFGV